MWTRPLASATIRKLSVGRDVERPLVRRIGKLSALAVSRAKVPRYYGDGGGLWLQVSNAGTKSWVFRFTLHGRSREMGLGALHTISLAEAREAAQQCRKLLHEGIDPIEDRRKKRRSTRHCPACLALRQPNS